jgi:chitodextrinase
MTKKYTNESGARGVTHRLGRRIENRKSFGLRSSRVGALLRGLTSTKVLAIVGLLIGVCIALGGQTKVDAAACAAATTDLGTDTLTVNVPAAATYTIWTRMKAPDATHNSINLQVDTTDCFAVGGGAFTATAWNADSTNWIKYASGATSNQISLALTAGPHTLKYIGTQAGVEVDRIILSSDPACVPVGTGNNCQSGDSTAPTVSLQTPTANQAVTGTLNMTATAADASGISQVKFMVDGQLVGTSTTAPYAYAWNSAAVANGAHTVTAQATDTAGNTATSAAVSITVTNAVSCSGNPTVPGNLHVSATTASTITIDWNASTAATGCTMQGYKIYRGGNLVTTATGTTFTDTGLTPGATYSYTIAAADTSGHSSAQTAAVTGSTGSDAVAPTAPTSVHTTLVGSNSIALAWTASTDNTGVTSYDILRNGTKVGSSATTSFTDSSLTPNTTYSYTVVARDAAGNSSTPSAALSAKTTAGTAANSGDLNGDGKVNITDLSILLSHWNATGVPVTQGDVNADGKVNLTDLSIMLSHWG